MTETRLFIDGEWRAGRAGPFTSHDPATGADVWTGRAADAQDVADAVSAARAAFPAWSRTPLKDRRAIVRAFKAEVERRKGELVEIIARETGKTRWECEGEAGAVAAKIDISVIAQDERAGEKDGPQPFGRSVLRHKGHGVMAVFGPYNFPAHLPNGHIVPALLAGDTVVFKPSEITPAVGAFLVECWAAAGAPKGVVNLVQGARETGAALLDARIDGVLFTGSVDTGVMIHRKFAGRPDVILALEMGGNNPLVVWDAEDADAAALVALHSAYITTGQRCSCARRLMVPEGAAGDALVNALDGLLGRIRIGAWDAEPEPFIGPLVSEAAADRVLEAQADLVARGGEAIREAKRLAQGGAFVSPGLIDMTGVEGVPDKEVFGPLLQVRRESSFEAALARANDTAFGLSAGLVSDDAALWERFLADIRAGLVNWNRPTTGAASSAPFGGPGFSGNHRPSAYYAADYCAYPIASFEAPALAALATKGLA